MLNPPIKCSQIKMKKQRGDPLLFQGAMEPVTRRNSRPHLEPAATTHFVQERHEFV